jgi:nicotinate-nucleotide adenylyltransferase
MCEALKIARIISSMNTRRIGIYAGVFDPVHSGHISFALQALHEVNLDEVYFLPERKPYRKPGAEHYGHRVAMLRQALQPHSQLALAEVVDRRFTVKQTVQRLRKTFQETELVFLMGADVFAYMPQWDGVERFIERAQFAVAVRSPEELQAVNATLQFLEIPTNFIQIIDTLSPKISSTNMRNAIRRHTYTSGLLASVEKYAKREWLYASVRQNI